MGERGSEGMGRFDANALIRKVDLLTLRIFLTVAEEGQLARAASREHIVPSAVTKRIQELEDLVGLKLFHRVPKGVQLTPAGEVAAEHLRKLFNQIEQMQDEIGGYADGRKGHVRVGATESIIIEFLASEIQKFGWDYPDITVELLPLGTTDIIQHFAAGGVDVGIYATYGSADGHPLTGIRVSEFKTDQLVAVVPNAHPLAKRADYGLHDLIEAGLIGLRPTSPFMMHLRKFAEGEGFSLRLKYEVTTNEAARALVRAGLGVSIQPRGVLDLEDYARMSILPLKESWATRDLSLITQCRRPLTAAEQAFTAHVLSSIA